MRVAYTIFFLPLSSVFAFLRLQPTGGTDQKGNSRRCGPGGWKMARAVCLAEPIPPANQGVFVCTTPPETILRERDFFLH